LLHACLSFFLTRKGSLPYFFTYTIVSVASFFGLPSGLHS
jgi:hypothetical protein